MRDQPSVWTQAPAGVSAVRVTFPGLRINMMLPVFFPNTGTGADGDLIILTTEIPTRGIPDYQIRNSKAQTRSKGRRSRCTSQFLDRCLELAQRSTNQDRCFG